MKLFNSSTTSIIFVFLISGQFSLKAKPRIRIFALFIFIHLFANFLINSLTINVKKFLRFVENDFDFTSEYPFNQIYLWLEKEVCDETIEYIVSMMMEPFDEIIKPLRENMSSDEEKYFRIPTNRTVSELKDILESILIFN